MTTSTLDPLGAQMGSVQELPLLETVAIALQARSQGALGSSTTSHHRCTFLFRKHQSDHLSPDSQHVYVDGSSICIENQAPLPLEKCIFTNEPSDEIRSLPLRDHNNPGTWWGKRPRLRVGVSRKAINRIRLAELKTWSALAVGLTFLAVGIFGTLNGMSPAISLPFYAAGSLTVMISGWFRAKCSVRAPQVCREYAVVTGAHPEYLKQFDHCVDGEFVSPAYWDPEGETMRH